MGIKAILPMSVRYRIMGLRGRGIYSEYADEYECIFIHIPKTAGTSMAMVLFDKDSRHVRYTEYEKADWRKFKRYFKFTFVRNPWDRLVSAYFFLKQGGLSEQDREWAKDNLQDYPDFKGFVLDWINETNIWTSVHFLPQYHFVCDSADEVMMDFVGRFESIESDFLYVAKRLGCTRSLSKTNAGSQQHYSNYYDEETQEIVRQAYARDIELFGYEFGR